MSRGFGSFDENRDLSLDELASEFGMFKFLFLGIREFLTIDDRADGRLGRLKSFRRQRGR